MCYCGCVVLNGLFDNQQGFGWSQQALEVDRDCRANVSKTPGRYETRGPDSCHRYATGQLLFMCVIQCVCVCVHVVHIDVAVVSQYVCYE